MAFKLSRRAMLKGIGGVGVALPMLEVMRPGKKEAQAAAGDGPKRYVVSYCGVSIGCTFAGGAGHANSVVPKGPPSPGAPYELTRGLAPLGELGVANEVGIVSGLKIPWQANSSAAVPAGGRTLHFHYNTLGPSMSGMRGAHTKESFPQGPTSDQIVKDRIAGETDIPYLGYRVQAARYVADDDYGGFMSAGYDANGVFRQRLDPTDIQPRAAYASLFDGFLPSDPAAKAQAEFLLKRRKSVLDLVKRDRDALLQKVGRFDRIRLEQHFDEISSMESRIASAQSTGGACEPLPAPANMATGGNYSNEEERARLMVDAVAMAFACDRSRVAALMFTHTQCFMNAAPIVGHREVVHQLSHFNASQFGVDALADAIGWHVRHFGRLVKILRDTPEGSGSILDNTALALCFEGGHGVDPEAQQGLVDEPVYSAHSTENMAVIYAGRAGGLRPGKHIVARDRHPASVLVSNMQAVGVDGGLGEVTNNIPEMFQA